MDIRIKQHIDELYLENYQDISYLDIKYGGSFNAQMVSDCDVFLQERRIIIFNINLQESGLLMTYDGNFIIRSVLAYTHDKVRHYIPTTRVTDEWGKVGSDWVENRATWESYNRSNRMKKRVQTSISKVVGSKKQILTKRGMNVRNSS